MKRAEGSISGGFWAVETGARADGWLRTRSDSTPIPWLSRIADRMGEATLGAFWGFFVALCRLVRIMTTIEWTKPFNAPFFGLDGVGLYTHNTPNYTVTRANLGRIRWYRGDRKGVGLTSKAVGLSLQAGNGGFDGR